MPLAASILALLIAAPTANALEPQFKANIGASYWGLGLKLTAVPALKQRLWGEDGSMLFGNTFLRADVVVDATPAYVRASPRITFSPIAIFETSANCGIGTYFGNFSTVVGFENPTDGHAPDDLTARDEFQGTGWNTRCMADATLQAKAGPVIVASWGSWERWVTHPGDKVVGDYFYESETDMLFSMDETLWGISGVLAYEYMIDEEAGRRLLIGDMTNWKTTTATDEVLFKTGLMLAYEPNPQWNYLLLVQPYLTSRTYDSLFPPYIAARVQWTMPPK